MIGGLGLQAPNCSDHKPDQLIDLKRALFLGVGLQTPLWRTSDLLETLPQEDLTDRRKFNNNQVFFLQGGPSLTTSIVIREPATDHCRLSQQPLGGVDPGESATVTEGMGNKNTGPPKGPDTGTAPREEGGTTDVALGIILFSFFFCFV